MEGLIRGDAISKTEIGPLLVEQRRIGDEYRVVEKAIHELHNLLAAKNVDPADRTEMEAGVISRTDRIDAPWQADARTRCGGHSRVVATCLRAASTLPSFSN